MLIFQILTPYLLHPQVTTTIYLKNYTCSGVVFSVVQILLNDHRYIIGILQAAFCLSLIYHYMLLPLTLIMKVTPLYDTVLWPVG